jgi:hypothetical protein
MKNAKKKCAKMRSILTIALVAVIGFSACEDKIEDEDEASFLMEGSSTNSYFFSNDTSFDVKVKIGNEKKTITAHNSSSIHLSSSSASSNTVKYSPASKVMPMFVIKGSATFRPR